VGANNPYGAPPIFACGSDRPHDDGTYEQRRYPTILEISWIINYTYPLLCSSVVFKDLWLKDKDLRLKDKDL